MNCLTAEAATRPRSLAKPLDQLRATHPAIVGRLATERERGSADRERAADVRSGVPLMCCIKSCRVFAPLNGRVPVSSSWNTIARLYWSEKRRHPALERLRRGIDRRDPAGDRRADAFEQFGETEVADLDVVEDQEQVLRLDVEMLNLVLVVHQVQCFGRFVHVAEQFVARDARLALAAALAEAVPEVAVGQLHHDDELAIDDVESFE